MLGNEAVEFANLEYKAGAMKLSYGAVDLVVNTHGFNESWVPFCNPDHSVHIDDYKGIEWSKSIKESSDDDGVPGHGSGWYFKGTACMLCALSFIGCSGLTRWYFGLDGFCMSLLTCGCLCYFNYYDLTHCGSFVDNLNMEIINKIRRKYLLMNEIGIQLVDTRRKQVVTTIPGQPEAHCRSTASKPEPSNPTSVPPHTPALAHSRSSTNRGPSANQRSASASKSRPTASSSSTTTVKKKKKVKKAVKHTGTDGRVQLDADGKEIVVWREEEVWENGEVRHDADGKEIIVWCGEDGGESNEAVALAATGISSLQTSASAQGKKKKKKMVKKKTKIIELDGRVRVDAEGKEVVKWRDVEVWEEYDEPGVRASPEADSAHATNSRQTSAASGKTPSSTTPPPPLLPPSAASPSPTISEMSTDVMEFIENLAENNPHLKLPDFLQQFKDVCKREATLPETNLFLKATARHLAPRPALVSEQPSEPKVDVEVDVQDK